MPYLLNAAYLIALTALLPWFAWQAFTKGKYREGFAAKFLGRAPQREGNRPCVWLHAVSVGEVNLLAPLLKQIASERPDWQCVLSTTTMTGMAVAKKKYPQLMAFYCPLDFTWAVRCAMRRIRPDVLVLAELELWPNLICAAKAAGAKVAVINGRLSERSFRGYRRIRPLLRGMLRRLDLIAVQDETYAERFRQLGAGAASLNVTGSMKYDGAQTDRSNANSMRLAALAGIEPTDIVFLAGSTQEPEEAAAIEVFRALSGEWPQLRLVIVPRHPDRFDAVARLLDASKLPWQRRTQLDAGADAKRPTPRILLVDSVGELGAWWGTATIAFVGGSLGNRGGQNMIEPAAYGAAVCFGPNTRNFRDIVSAMLAKEAAVVVADGDALGSFVRRCLAEPAFAADLGQRGQALVQSQLGATGRTLALLESLMSSGG